MTMEQPGLVRGFLRGAREVVLLEHAERRAAEIDEAERTRRTRCLVAARKRRAASRKLSSPVAAVVLLRDALGFALRIDGDPGSDLAASVAIRPELDAVPEARDAVLAALRSESAFAIDDLPFPQAEALRSSFEACIARITGKVDLRTPTAVRALRWGRIAALAIIVLLFVAAELRSKLGTPNVALDKRVITSPLRPDTPSADHVVDGVTRGTFGVHTAESARPFVEVDLQARYMIDRVRIFNRGDGWFDECLPLALEVSDDGVQFHEVARRVDHFDVWTVPLDGRAARYVRVFKAERGYFALNEIEVYGRPVR